MSTPEDLQVAESRDEAMIASVIDEAFLDDPFLAWLMPIDLVGREKRHRFWQLVVESRPDRAHVVATSDGSAAALWHKPKLDEPARAEAQKRNDEQSAQSESLVMQFMKEQLGDLAETRLQGMGKVGEAHPEAPHWYLAAIGTRVAAQGRGRGAALMAPILRDCDTRGIPAYLESSNPRNLPFYFRHGFEAIGELVMPDKAASMTAMWREPR